MSQTCKRCQSGYSTRLFSISGPPTCCPRCCKELQTLTAASRPPEYWHEQYMAADLPKMHTTFRDTPAYAKAKGLVDTALDTQSPLFLHGSVATGKTLTLVLLATKLVQCYNIISFIQCAKFSTWLRMNPESHNSMFAKLTTVNHLFLDDIGTEHDKTGWWTSWVDGIVDYRYSNMLPTSASTNVPDKLDARVVRRLTETCIKVEIR